MSLSLSHRQAGVTRGDLAGLIRHEYRDLDLSSGIETSHSNERIVAERTPQNHSFIWIDGAQSKLTSSGQILDELDRRLAKAGGSRVNAKTGAVKRIAIRKDAAVVRNIVLQLDPSFTGSSEYLTSAECPEAHFSLVMKHLGDLVRFYGDLYGRENLLSLSVHLDETTPHVHLMVTPIDGQGRVRQASFIEDGRGAKSGLAAVHRRAAEFMRERGYDADLAPRGVNRSHMSVDEFARYDDDRQQHVVRGGELEDRAAHLQSYEQNVLKRRRDVEDFERDVRQQYQETVASEKAVEEREVAVQKREIGAIDDDLVRYQRSTRRETALDARESSLESREASVVAREADAVKTAAAAVQSLMEREEQARSLAQIARKIHEEARKTMDEAVWIKANGYAATNRANIQHQAAKDAMVKLGEAMAETTAALKTIKTFQQPIQDRLTSASQARLAASKAYREIASPKKQQQQDDFEM